jgi:hypothetical protein
MQVQKLMLRSASFLALTFRQNLQFLEVFGKKWPDFHPALNLLFFCKFCRKLTDDETDPIDSSAYNGAAEKSTETRIKTIDLR